MKIRTKLLLSYVLLSTLPLIIVCTIFYFNASQALVTQARGQIKNIAEKSIEQITSFFDVCSDNTKELAETPLSVMSFLLRDFDQDLAPTIEKFRDYIKERSYIIQIKIVDLNGKEILSTLEANQNKTLDESKNIWFQKASISGETYTSDMHISEDLGVPIVTMARSIFDGTKKKGVLAIDIEGKAITTFVDKVKIGKTGYGYIINKSGFVIAHPIKNKILTENLAKSDSQTLREVIKDMLAMKSGGGRYSYEGVDKYVFYEPYQPLGWSAGITLPTSELMVNAYALIRIMFGVGALVLIITIIVAFLISRGITNSKMV